LERDGFLFEIEIFRRIPHPPNMAAGNVEEGDKNTIELCKLSDGLFGRAILFAGR
jgi:hypothetical protein